MRQPYVLSEAFDTVMSALFVVLLLFFGIWSVETLKAVVSVRYAVL